MKKLKRNRVTAAGIIAGAMVVSSGLMSGCADNMNEGVYGPPQDAVYESENNIPTTVYGPPEDPGLSEFDPELNELEDVYGPPEYFQ